MRSMRPFDPELIENHAQSFLARMVCIDGLDVAGNGDLVGSIFSSDADLGRNKDILPTG